MKRILFSIIILATTVSQAFAISGTVVTKTTDDGTAGTLRYAITTANGVGSGIISIQTTGTITLTSPLPLITAPITIVCTDATGITISGNNSYRVFSVQLATGTVGFKNLNIVNGLGDGGGGGINAITSNNAKVAIENCTISGCQATGSQAFGGAIQSTANVDLLNCTLTGNSAIDGGGAIEMLDGSGTSILTINHCTIAQNSTAATDIAGGIDLYMGSIVIANSIVVSNSNGNASSASDVSIDISNVNSNTSAYNLYTTAPFAGIGDLGNKTVGQIGLSALANNGGSVKTMAISLSSLARNSATGALATDARGVARDANPDRGAYEAPAPTATTAVATNITTTTATLNGVYDPKIFTTHSAQFEYGSTTGTYTHTVTAVVEPVTNICSYAVSGQTAGSTVYYRLVATVDGVKFYGTEQTFELQTATAQNILEANRFEILYSVNTHSIEVVGDFDYLEVYNITGALILKSNTKTTELPKAKGIVVVKVYSPNGVKTKKIVL